MARLERGVTSMVENFFRVTTIFSLAANNVADSICE